LDKGAKIIVHSRDRCYDFKTIFGEKFGEKLAFLTQNKAILCKILIITLYFLEKRQFFSPKIAENRDHNIGPREELA
jgi:hypothetical protein